MEPADAFHPTSYDAEGGRAAPAAAVHSLASVDAVVLPRGGAQANALPGMSRVADSWSLTLANRLI